MTATEVAASLDRDYGKGSVKKPGQKVMEEIDAISTGCPQLDIAIGIGGFPVGRVGEIYGPESSGKTTIVYHLIAEAQKKGPCVFIDVEHDADPSYARAIGVDWDALYFLQPNTAEEALDAAIRFAGSGDIALIAVDSVAEMTPRSELEGDVGDANVAQLPRLMSKACRMLKKKTSATGTSVLFTNQLRETIGEMFGPRVIQPGGRALKFAASVRMDIRRIETVGTGNESSANRVRVKVVKNKVAAPNRQAEFEITYGTGIDRNAAILDLTTNPGTPGYVAGLARRAGGYYQFNINGEDASVQGRAAATQLLADNPEFAANLYQKILEANQ